MADEDFVDFDQEWFFDELKGDQTEGTTLDPPLPPTPPPAASSSTNNHGSTSQSHPPIQQQVQQPSHQSNTYQEQQMGQRDGMMPSTSTYGMQQQQHQPLQEQQQVPVSQHQQIHIQQAHQQQPQQQFETLQPYNPNQQNQNIQNHYQQNSQQMIFDMEMDYISNEASTSSAMPMECRISQDYNQPQQYQPQQQQQQGETQWIQMEQPSLMSQQHAPQMTSVVYTSTSQQMPRIPDPGGQHTNQPQILNNYNPQQTQHIIQTGINGQTMLASMQPVQRIIPQQQQPQQSQQQQFELNSNNYIQQQVAYIDHTGSQQFITSQPGEVGNVNFHQMQVIPQIVPIQSAPAVETPAPAPAPPPTAKPKATKAKGNARKKNQPPPQQPQPSAEGDSILSKIEKSGSVAVNFNDNPEKSAKMAQLMGMMAALAANEAQGFDVTEARSSLEKQLEELLTGANIIPQPTPVPPPPPKPTATYAPIAPNVPSSAASTPQQPKSKKARTKAEGQQNLQQKRAANSTASNANINSNINTNMQPQIIQQQQLQQPQQPQNESGCRIISQDANYLIVESNGTIMKAVNVRTENGTATYQILGPVDEQTLYQLKQSQQPPPQPLPPSTSQPQQQQQQKRVQSIQPSTFKSENDEAAPAAVLDVVNSLSSSNKSKPQKKTPARARNKKASEPPPPPPPPAVAEQKPVVIKEQEIPKPEPTVICVPSASKEPPKPKIVFPAIAVSAKRVKDKTDSRKRRIAEWVKKMKEVIATTDINSPFIDKEDVFNRLMPYGFHYEPEFSQKTMEKVEHELIRHQTHLLDRYKSIEGKMQQIFIRETTNQNYDLETNMLLAIDAEYERQQLEKDKALFQHDPYQFIRQSDVVKTPSLNLDYITETRRLLNLNKPKNIKPTKGFHFEPSNFDETEFIKRKNKLVEEDEKEKAEKLAALKKAHQPPPIQKPPPPKPVLPILTPKLPPKPSIEPVKINLKLQENTVPVNKELPKIKKPIIFTSSSESSSSDDEYVKRSKTSKSKKAKSFRSPSPQKERKSKSPQKSKHIDLSVSSKEKANHVSADKLNNKQHQPPIKTTIRKPMPSELNAFYPSMNLSGYKIPKIGDPTPPPTSTKPLPIKQESVQKEPPKFVEPIPKEFLKPSEPVTTKMKENVVKVKENIVQTLKIKKSSLSNSMDSISTHKEKKEKHHHHHHHSSKNNERSNSVISNHSTEKSSKNVERSESLNREITKVPSLVIKPPSQFKHPNEIKKEEKRSKEKEASSSSSSKDKRQKDTVKTEEKPLKTKTDTPKPENPERVVQQSLKLKINIGSKKPVESPSTVNSIKESIPSPNNPAVEHKKKDKKDKHSKESRKEKKVKEEALPVLEIMEDNINHIREAEEDEAAKEAKRKRKEEKKRQKAEKKQQKKLEKKQRKHQKEEKDETVKTTTPQINSAGGDHIKLKFSLKKPTKPVESSPSHPPSPPPPKLQPEIAPFETTPKLKFTISRNILPESTKNVKKEKDRNLKRASPKVESEPNSEAPPLKIPRVKIKLGGSQNHAAAAASSSSTSYAAASTPILPLPSTTETATTSIPSIAAAAVVEKKKSIVLKQTENSENSTSSLPLQQQPQQSTPVERPSMVGKPPTSAIENVSATPAKIRRIKKSKHGGSGFSDCSDVEETQVDLRLMTDRILSRCRD